MSTIMGTQIVQQQKDSIGSTVLHFPYKEGMELGRGINSLNGESTNSGLLSGEKQGPIWGKKFDFWFKSISSANELHSLTSANAEASLNYGLFSANGSLSASLKENISCQKTVFIAFASIAFSSTTFQNEAVKDDPYIKQDIEGARNNPEPFVKKYGDYFVKSIKSGGYLAIMVSIFSKSENEQREIAAKIHSSFQGLFGSLEGQAQINNELKSASTRSEISYSIVQSGGPINTIEPLNDSSSIFKRVNEFITMKKEESLPLSIIAAPFASLPSFPILENSRWKRQQLAKYAELKISYDVIRGQINFIKKNTNLFASFDQQKLNELQKAIDDGESILEQTTTNCENSNSTNEVKQCPSLSLPLPLNYMPQRIDHLDPEESQRLGKVWKIIETYTWVGTWTRKSDYTREFSAHFTCNDEEETADLKISIKKDGTVIITRYNSVSSLQGKRTGNCTYEGKISEDGNSVEGTYNCDWAQNKSLPWHGVIGKV